MNTPNQKYLLGWLNAEEETMSGFLLDDSFDIYTGGVLLDEEQ